MRNYASAQRQIQKLLHDLVEQGVERGIQVAAYLDGEQVIDAWAGIANPDTGREVDENTLFPVFSTGKGISATAVHILAERGRVNYDLPIADCWPEFARNGKGNITMRQLLCHTAGMPHMPDMDNIDEICDWQLMCGKVAAQTPLWPPGTRTCYHAITFSWLVGETARRLDGRDFNSIVQDEICRPLGIKSLFLGIPDGVEGQVATLDLPQGKSTLADDPLALRTIPPLTRPLEAFMNLPQVRSACIPASNGIMNARAIARHYAALIGEVDGVRLLSPSTLATATTLNAPPDVPPNELPNKFGLGYILSGPESNYGQIFGHGGYGGTNGFADTRRHLAIGITKNRLNTPCPDLTAAIRDALGLL